VLSRGRLPGVEGLRGIAACAIVLHHGWLFSNPDGPSLGRGGAFGTLFSSLALGVTLFFALSGFLLYRPFAAALLRGRDLPAIGAYFRNRALRILPAYWCILLVAALVLRSASVRAPDGRLVTGALSDPVVLGQTALLLQDYRPQTLLSGIGPAWSLAVEAVFYVVLPLLALCASALAGREATRRRRVLALLSPALLLLAVGLSGKYVAGAVVASTPGAGWEADWHSVIERSFWAQADLFSFGMAAAVLHVQVEDGRLRLPPWWRAAALVLAAVLFLPAAKSMGSGQLSYLPQNTVIALSAALLLAAVVVRRPGEALPWTARLLEARVFVATGLISYSLFLWNEPLIRWMESHGWTSPGWGGLAVTLLILSVLTAVLSVLTYRFVEVPALRRKSRRAAPVPMAQVEAAP
jgi:peptidoglycan/LPS O-acetylase OafA/YrhL